MLEINKKWELNEINIIQTNSLINVYKCIWLSFDYIRD